MKLNAKAFANASAIIVGILYVVCVGLTVVAPDFLISLGNSWFHAIDLAKIQGVDVTFGSFLFGLVSIVIVAWAADYLFAVMYNSFIKQTEQ